MAKLNKTVIAALTMIMSTNRVTFAVGKPLVDQGLIEVNKEDVQDEGDAATYAAKLTQKAFDGMPKQSGQPASSGPAKASDFAIFTNATPPESKRGVGREAGPSKYPFDDMPVNGSFFVPVSDETPDPLKTLGSAVSNATNKYRVDTGKTESKERTKRGEGNKAVLDTEGKKFKETVTVPIYDYPRKYIIRGVKKDQKCGEWSAPADGVLISRTK